jgi:omega-6 fatty acid desaturase (delta-12 desaturase)
MIDDNRQETRETSRDWIEVVKKYNQPDVRKSVWQIINSLGPYMILWFLMYLSLEISYLLTLGLAIVTAAFQVRTFIIFHDCGHGSFFKSTRANKIVGTIMGSLSFTPYTRWHLDHSIHHSNVGNLDKRGIGDVMTLTVEEYNNLSKSRKLYYRIYRHPVVLFVFAPALLFVIWFRFTRKSMDRSVRNSVYLTNVIVFAMAAGLILLMGWKAYLMIQIPVIIFATSAGVWLFYVQHQFENVIWTRSADWDYKKMALEGSSYLKFPNILQWFSGNIGFHHIHHLSPKIPNYKLERCHKENRMFHSIKPVKFLDSLKTMNLFIWDEGAGRLLSKRQFRKIARVHA